jgi:hypothetical protein
MTIGTPALSPVTEPTGASPGQGEAAQGNAGEGIHEAGHGDDIAAQGTRIFVKSGIRGTGGHVSAGSGRSGCETGDGDPDGKVCRAGHGEAVSCGTSGALGNAEDVNHFRPQSVRCVILNALWVAGAGAGRRSS